MGVAFHPDINEEWSAVLVHGNAAGIVVVVAVAVGAKLCTQHPAALPCGINAYTGVPYCRTMLGNCGVFHQFLLGKGGGQPVPQVDVGAAVRVLQMVGVGIGAEISRRKRLQSITAHGLPKAIFPRTTAPGKGTAIAKVQVVRAVHMDVADVLRDIFDLCFSE